MAIVLGRQSALRVWNGLAAGGRALGCRNVATGQGSPEDQGSPAGQGSPVNQNSPADQGSLAERDALVGRDTFPNQDAAACPSARSNRNMPAMFQSSRDYRRRLERDTKAAVKLLESGAAPAFDPSARAHFFGDEASVHATVAHARLRRARGGIETSVRKGPFHPRSFMQIENGLYISTPEMAFCEMASVLSLEQLIALGFELCGTYRRTSTFDSAQYDAAPLTSPRALAAFVDQSPQFKGAKKTRRALAHIVAGSASPRESELAMLLCLPYSLGGYGLPHPIMNAEMPLPKTVAATGRASLRCDLYWPAARLDVEYDSSEYHSAERLLANDSIRRTALESMGVTSVNVTAEHLRRAPLFDEAVHGIARILGKRLRLPVDFRLKQEKLWRELGIVVVGEGEAFGEALRESLGEA